METTLGSWLLSDFEPHVLLQLHPSRLDHVADLALVSVGVDELLVEQDALGVESVHLALGDLFGDLLRLSGGPGLGRGDLAPPCYQRPRGPGSRVSATSTPILPFPAVE